MKPRTEQKLVSMSFRLPAAEAVALKKQAAAEGMSVSELIREKALADTDFASRKKQQEYFAERMMVAAAFQEVKKEVREQGCNIDLDLLERRIYQSCL